MSRFIVRCCTADAIAVNIPVRYDRAADLPRDTWVQVEGTIRASGTPEQMQSVVEAQKVDLVAQPSQPYLYP